MANDERASGLLESDHAPSDYVPLMVLVAVSALAATAIASGFAELAMRSVMHAYMGVFLCFFSVLKLFDLRGFAHGFEMYDLAGRRSRAYALLYPFLELGLGLAYLAFLAPLAVQLATIALFAFGACGVLRALKEGVDIDCPCMGNVLSVPLSTVTLVEDLTMIAMAGILILVAV